MTFLDATQFSDHFAPESSHGHGLAPRLTAFAMLLLPIVAVVAVGALEGYVIVTSGWSPGFAVALAVPRIADI